jgi:hypothetical protein
VNTVGETDTTTVSATPITAPAAPQINTPTRSAALELSVSWDEVTSTPGAPVSGYRLYRAVDTAGTCGVFTQAAQTSGTSYADSDRTAGVTYCYQVSAYGTAGEGPRSATVKETAIDAPNAATGVTPSAGDTSVSLSWTLSPSTARPITAVKVLRGGIVVATLAADATSYSDTGLTNGTSYSYVIRTVNTVGETDTTTVSATPITTASAPTISTVTAGNQQLSVAFSAPASTGGTAITSYQYSTDGGSTWRARAAGTTASPLVITTGSSDNATLVNGTSYSVRIRAVNAAGNGEQSNAVSATPITTPGAPTITAVTGGDRRVTVSWSAPASTGGSPITTYYVYLKKSTDSTWSFLGFPAGTTSYTFQDYIDYDVTYQAKVTALNAAGESAFSSTLQSTTWRSTMLSGETLTAGQELKSANGQYRAVNHLADSNFVVYQISPFTALWSSNTVCNNCYLYVKISGGILYIFDGNHNVYKRISAASNGSRLILQNDGYLWMVDSAGNMVWNSWNGPDY